MTGTLESSPNAEMGPTDIYCGSWKVISSGTITAFNRQPIKIIFGRMDKRLNLILTFIDEPNENKKSQIKAESLGDNSLQLTLSNFRSPLGSYNTTPIYIAHISGFPVYLSLLVVGSSEGDHKIIHFTVYIETSDKSPSQSEVSGK